MPEYLSPGVYVEEFAIGAAPIEGVSTSTAGFVGMAEKGPLNKAVFVDSFAAYQSVFGGYLEESGSDSLTYGDLKCLPRSVEAFFSNGGKQAYVVRVAYVKAEDTDSAAKASINLQDSAAKNVILATALSEGTWGNDVSIAAAMENSPVISTTVTSYNSANNSVVLANVNAIEVGTVLLFPTTQYRKVTAVVASTKTVTLDSALTTAPVAGDPVSSVEFGLTIEWNNTTEVFHNLSMASTHSRFIETIVNNTATKTDGSNLVSVKKLLDPTSEPFPPAPAVPAPNLTGGKDGVPSDTNTVGIYIGADDVEPANCTGLYVLKNLDDVSIVLVPGMTHVAIQSKVISLCERLKDRFAVLDSGKGANLDTIKAQRSLYDTEYAAIYYPWITVYDAQAGENINVPPSGFMAGIYADTDVQRGVHKAPANEVVSTAIDLETQITTGVQDVLNPLGINCIRALQGRGIRAWGARTMSSDGLWNYITVRRLFIYLEKSISVSTQWVVFEPNDVPLWARVKQTIVQFLTDQWRAGMLAGSTVDEAFFVKCDRTTMSQGDIDNGRLICVIGVAPVKPAEFVVFRIAQWTAGAKS